VRVIGYQASPVEGVGPQEQTAAGRPANKIPFRLLCVRCVCVSVCAQMYQHAHTCIRTQTHYHISLTHTLTQTHMHVYTNKHTATLWGKKKRRRRTPFKEVLLSSSLKGSCKTGKAGPQRLGFLHTYAMTL